MALQRYLDYCNESFVNTDRTTVVDKWQELFEKYPSAIFKKDKKDNEAEVQSLKNLRVNVIWHYQIVLSWWNYEGRQVFPNILPTAMIALGKPYTNAQQERVFSKVTWMDGKLRQSQSMDTLNKRVPCSVNREVVPTLRRLAR